MSGRWRAGIGLGGVLAIAALLIFGCARFQGRPAAALGPTAVHADDASRLNLTRVAEVVEAPRDAAALESQLGELLARARAQGRRVSIAGARHTMGGHTIYPDGIVLDTRNLDRMELVDDERVVRVGSGARWSDVIRFLDARGLSVNVMQSNNDFSVGGSVSVNCHGWQHDSAPIVATVRSFRLMTADGAVVRCSRDENAELFGLAIGGYGLFGIILDVDLRVIPNQRYRPEAEVLSSDAYASRFAERVQGQSGLGMAYGRLCIVPGELFLREAILTRFREAPCSRPEMPALGPDPAAAARREVYLGQIGSAAGKSRRWQLEKEAGELGSRPLCSRNQVLDESAALYGDRRDDRTDILAEYFIPRARLEDFLVAARSILAEARCDLLNVTIRDVRTDTETVLRYAREDVFGLVMLFNLPRTATADAELGSLDRRLIDAALASGGTYYLPYRLHAPREQFARAYPSAEACFERKRHYDPDELFQNAFYVKYGRP